MAMHMHQPIQMFDSMEWYEFVSIYDMLVEHKDAEARAKEQADGMVTIGG